MNTTKRINVNFSSLVGLKAELLRKQTEVNEAKLRAEAIHTIPKVKKKIKKSKENKAAEKSEELKDVDDINTHKKSKLMLEAKARLYSRLKKSRNNNDNFLVDFTNKSDESEEESKDDPEDDIGLEHDEDGWVEYVDCFGRTRKCLREDLPIMQEKDELLKQQIMDKRNKDERIIDTAEYGPMLQEKEPEIEIMRRKWEEQTQKLADKANIHYQDVLFDEARAHGVGYYAFSQDEEERIKQQENLINLRKQTEQKQKEMKELKELREKMELNRLKAARIRQRIRAGLPAEPTEEELQPKTDNMDNADTLDIVPDSSKAQSISIEESKTEHDDKREDSSSEDTAIVKEDKIRALGELLGKRTHWYEMSQEEWVEKCRKVRVNEFGPVYDNFISAGSLESENGKKQLTKGEKHNSSEPDIESSAKEEETSSCIESHSTLDVKTQSVSTSVIPNNISGYHGTNATVKKGNHLELTNCSMMEPFTDHNLPYNVQSYQSYTQKIPDTNIISQPETVKTGAVAFSKAATQNVTSGNINEESIMAGLRYLREKFEESHNT